MRTLLDILAWLLVTVCVFMSVAILLVLLLYLLDDRLVKSMMEWWVSQ